MTSTKQIKESKSNEELEQLPIIVIDGQGYGLVDDNYYAMSEYFYGNSFKDEEDRVYFDELFNRDLLPKIGSLELNYEDRRDITDESKINRYY